MADVRQILNERGKVHGDFTDHATFAQHLKRIAQSSKNWTSLNTVQTEGLEMILHKVARILAGNPNHADHWDDIAGYATLVSERLGKHDASERAFPQVDAGALVPIVPPPTTDIWPNGDPLLERAHVSAVTPTPPEGVPVTGKVAGRPVMPTRA
jgi:hypothetical protein